MYIKEEQRFWELTYGAEWVTCLIGQKTIYIHNYKLKYIFETLGVEKYLRLCSTASYKDNIPINLNNIELEKLNKEIVLSYAIFLHEFVMCDRVQYNERNKEFIIFNKEKDIILSENEMNILFDNFKQIYCLGNPKEDKLFSGAKPITEKGKELLEIFRKATAKVNSAKSGVHTIDSIIMGVTSKHPSYNLLNIFELTMWQLMKTHSAMYKNDSIYFTNIGVYTGNIDTKKSKIKPEELDWSVRTD